MNLSSAELLDLENKLNSVITFAGEYIKDSWNKISDVVYKDARDVVTNVDISTEELLRKHLSNLLPEAGFIVEEGITQKKAEYNWAIDPIDGTKNFANHLPLFVTQVALMKGDNPVLGIIYNPLSNQLFSASLGNGTRLNGKNVMYTKRNNISSSIIDIDFGGSDDEIDHKLKITYSLAKKCYRIRIYGGIVACYLITGAIDVYIILNKKNKLVDLAPNMIILKEAGVMVDFVDVPHYKKVLVCAGQTLFEEIKSTLLSRGK